MRQILKLAAFVLRSWTARLQRGGQFSEEDGKAFLELEEAYYGIIYEGYKE